MFSTADTIVAIATPPGRGGIGVVRLSGPEAQRIVQELAARERAFEPRHATLATIHAEAGFKSGTDHLRPQPLGFERGWTDAGNSNLSVKGLRLESPTAEIDQAIVTVFPSPHSYTGDDVVEISAHGSPVVLMAIIRAALGCGARLAEPGEFTLRAFVNGRIDLPQAEAVADLIEASTPLQARTAFDQLNGTLTQTIETIDTALFDLIARLEASVDFPEDGYHFVVPGELASAIDAIRERTTTLLCSARRGRLVRDGLTIAIVGPPNVGKSSLFNALVGSARAIVTNVPGTTRDLVTETIDLDGLRVTLVDTAGLRETDDVVESEGVSRSLGAASVADVVLMVADISQPPIAIDDVAGRFPNARLVHVANKSDLHHEWSTDDCIEVSATIGRGLDTLRQRILSALDVELLADCPAITNVRHIALVEKADRALQRARAAVADEQSMPEEFVLADLQEARDAFEEITGRRTPDDLLAHIFERFCIGK